MNSVIYAQFGDLSTFVTSLSTDLTAANLWASVEPWSGVITTAVLFVLALTFGRRIIKGFAKGKVKI